MKRKSLVLLAIPVLLAAPLLILDDCLSAVDARTEKQIISNLKVYMEGKTSILITHRIFSLLNFDKIIVLEEGRIIEEGRHEELLQKKGVYYKMYLRQQEEQENR